MKVNYCQLSTDDESRHRGIELLNGILKSELRFAGWGRSLFGDVTFDLALRTALEKPGPLIISLANKGNELGEFYDFSSENDRYQRITPDYFWNGIPDTRWPGLKMLLDTRTNPSRQASPVYLVVWQTNGLAFARKLCQIAVGQMPADFNVFGSYFPATAQMLARLKPDEQAALATAHYYELEELCRLICRREQLAHIEQVRAKLY